MVRHSRSDDSICEISVDPSRVGLRAVCLVETRSTAEAAEIAARFDALAPQLQVRQLSSGRLVSFVVQADEQTPLLDDLEEQLKANYGFVVTQRSFDDLIYRIVTELCRDTGSKLLAMPHCNICGRPEPFPHTLVSLSDDDGAVLISRAYCATCTAAVPASSNKQFIRSLLAADTRDFGNIERAELVRRPTRKQPMRFRVKTA